jgi:hypothetical protein
MGAMISIHDFTIKWVIVMFGESLHADGKMLAIIGI